MSLLARYDGKDGDVDDNNELTQQDGRTLLCDKRDKAISSVFCRDLHLTSMFSGLLQKDLFKGK